MVKIGNVELGKFPIWLSPMEDVTDPPYRILCKEFGVDVLVTEFVPSDALIRDVKRTFRKLEFKEQERPLAIQIYGHDEDALRGAAEIAERYNPDFIDINWGCPVKKIAGRGAGSGILKDIPKMIKITKTIVDAVKLPVTVKTRLGWDETSKPIVEVAERLQDIGIQGLSIHGRTRAQMYNGEADWTLIGEVKNNPRMHIPIFGNGDINSPERALEMKNRYGVDGLLIGRAAIGNPFIFREVKHYLQTGELLPAPSVEERVEICKRHLLASIEWEGERKTIPAMRKHYHNYFKAIPQFKPLRIKLLQSYDLNEILEIFEEIKKTHGELS